MHLIFNIYIITNMDELTSQVSNLSIEKKKTKSEKVLYYSVKFFDYDFILKLVKKVLFDCENSSDTESNVKIEGGIYQLTESGVVEYGSNNIVELDEKYSSFVKKLKSGENFLIYDGKFYVINSEFHITTLYTGGKPHEKSIQMEAQTNKNVSVLVNKLGISNSFIALGVECIYLDDKTEIEYYGNDVKHITFGLAKFGKKVFPKDSYTCLSVGKVFALNTVIQAQTSKVIG